MAWFRVRFITMTGTYFEADLELPADNRRDAANVISNTMKEEESIVTHDQNGSYVIQFSNIAFVKVEPAFGRNPANVGSNV